jgi:hypothetical protein
MKPQIFPYNLIEEVSIKELHTRFSTHPRLSVFAQKGCVCVNCGKVGTRLLKGVDRGGNHHWDLYTDDLLPITVDHIIPKSLGGENHMDNYQPMCAPCNFRKGNGQSNQSSSKTPINRADFVKVDTMDPNFMIGKNIWKIRTLKTAKSIGIVDFIATNPHTNRLAAVVVKGDKHSYYDIEKSLYLEKIRSGQSKGLKDSSETEVYEFRAA